MHACTKPLEAHKPTHPRSLSLSLSLSVLRAWMVPGLCCWQDSSGIRPFTMPLMKLAATSIDQMPSDRDRVVESLLKYFHTDSLCLRAHDMDPLAGLPFSLSLSEDMDPLAGSLLSLNPKPSRISLSLSLKIWILLHVLSVSLSVYSDLCFTGYLSGEFLKGAHTWCSHRFIFFLKLLYDGSSLFLFVLFSVFASV